MRPECPTSRRNLDQFCTGTASGVPGRQYYPPIARRVSGCETVPASEPMTPTLILALSAMALSQFGLYLWRAAIISIAANSLTGEGPYGSGGGKQSNSLHKHDFHSLSAIHDICPALARPSIQLRFVRAYYQAIQLIGSICKERISSIANWAAIELEICTLYAAALVDQRRCKTQACYVEAGSF